MTVNLFIDWYILFIILLYYYLMLLIQIHAFCWCMEYYPIILFIIYVLDYFISFFIFITFNLNIFQLNIIEAELNITTWISLVALSFIESIVIILVFVLRFLSKCYIHITLYIFISFIFILGSRFLIKPVINKTIINEDAILI